MEEHFTSENKERWPSSEELGNIIMRLVIANAVFFDLLLATAKGAENKLIEGDVRKLELLGEIAAVLRKTLSGVGNP